MSAATEVRAGLFFLGLKVTSKLDCNRPGFMFVGLNMNVDLCHSGIANRRQFLISTTVASATCTLTYQISAAENLDPLVFLIASDTHLGRKDNQAAKNNWIKAVHQMNEVQAEFAIHLGDVVDSGRENQYPVYKSVKDDLKMPIYEIPGNHDPADIFKKHLADPIDRAFVKNGIRFVLFNNSRPNSHQGFISNKQLDWLEDQCESASTNKEKIIFCCHVPIHSNKSPDRGWFVHPENGQTRFYKIQNNFKHIIVACFHGHFHNGIRGWRDHSPTLEILCPSVCYNQNRNLKKHIAEGNATGFFVDELRPGFVMAKIGNGKVELQYKSLDGKGSASFSSND